MDCRVKPGNDSGEDDRAINSAADGMAFEAVYRNGLLKNGDPFSP